MDYEKMIEDMKSLLYSARDAYNDPKSDDERKRWGLYTGAAIQSILDGYKIKF